MRITWARGTTSLALFAGLMFGGPPALAQQPSPQGRDCQTVRTCNFSKTGAVRGCLSSYSCRTCKPVTVKCTLPGGGGKCQELRCDWGA